MRNEIALSRVEIFVSSLRFKLFSTLTSHVITADSEKAFHSADMFSQATT